MKTTTTIQFPAGIGLESQVRQAATVAQADAIVEMKACQIAQTGYWGRGKLATADQVAWAKQTDAARREREEREHVPGNCRGCNSSPCRCLA